MVYQLWVVGMRIRTYSTIQDYILTTKEVLKFSMEKIDKLKAYEDAEEAGLIIRLPIALHTPVLLIVGGGRLCYLKSVLFDFQLIKSYEDGMIFTDIEKAHAKLQELNKRI